MAQPQRERAPGADAAVDPNIRRLQDDLSEKLGATVAIEHSGAARDDSSSATTASMSWTGF